MKSQRFPAAVAVLLASLCLAPVASAQRNGEPVDREKIWPAPTAEDWAKPCLIPWQRTWDDALAVAKETGKPILICVNMDGEIASEHYAGVRYRQPEIAELFEQYVCVIASVYRHNPRDYDEHGNRIPCPRFGTVTCGEHIAIEPGLYEKFFDGKRIAPRHIMVELDGQEKYDVYYTWDVKSVFDTIQEGIDNRAVQPNQIARGDRTIVERVASRDSTDRMAVEDAYRQGDEQLRQRLLQAAQEHPEAAPSDLLRLAVDGLDPELSALARQALAKVDDPTAIGVINEALRVPLDPGQRDALIGALDKIGETTPYARTLAVVHRGLSVRSDTVDVAGWSERMGGREYAPPGREQLESHADEVAQEAAAKPDDAGAKLDLADTSLALALNPDTQRGLAIDPRTAPKYRKLMFQDVQRLAEQAQKLGADGWRVDALQAASAYYLGDREEAYRRAEAAMKDMPAGAPGAAAMNALAIFAEGRRHEILSKVRRHEDFPPQWLTDVDAAYAVLAKHPLGTDAQVAGHYDFLERLGAHARAEKTLSEGLQRFPESPLLHARLRSQVLANQGVGGLESTYADMMAKPDATKNLPWFAAYAAIVAAEFHRREGNRDAALQSYDHAIELYDRAIEANPEAKNSADHYTALALAGRARVDYELGHNEQAMHDILAAFAKKQNAANARDGLNISPIETAHMLLARLNQQGNDAMAKQLADGLGALDPSLLELPAFERELPRAPGEGEPPTSVGGDSGQPSGGR